MRGFDPWPGAYSHVGGKLLKIHRAKVVAENTKGSPGEIMRADAGGLGRHQLQCPWIGRGPLGNRKRLSGVEFLRGARIKPGDRLQ